jgi:phenylalanyl-tRNA synthetase beta chain
VNQVDDTKPTVNSKEVLIEASYIHPDVLVEAVAKTELEKDDLYYKTSRGSNPDLSFGLSFLAYLMEGSVTMQCYEGSLDVEVEREKEKVLVDANEISAIIGMDV